jgi:lysophospholipase L1-like esterase
MSNITTADITGVFNLDTGRLVGLAAKGSPDVTYLAGQDTPTSGIPLTVTLTSSGGVPLISGLGGLTDLKRFFGEVWDSGATAKYIVSGDSTRDNSYNMMIAYYTAMLAKVGVTVVDNAESGQSGQNWKNNVGAVTLAQAIAASGDGANVVLEFSFGINDYKNGATEADVEGWLTEGLSMYRSACPYARVLLVVPVYTAATDRNVILQNIYKRLSAKFGLPMVDVLAITGAVWNNTSYYYDGTHPNQYGSARIVNYILDKVLPADLYQLCKMDIAFFTGNTPPSTANMAGAVQSGYWNTVNGLPLVDAAWRRLPEIAVEPNFILRAKHQGNRDDFIFMDSTGAFISRIIAGAVSGWREVTIPADARFVRINISSAGSTYDALGDVVEVRYKIPEPPALTMAQINTGLSLRLASS